jgi:hypothetical protein
MEREVYGEGDKFLQKVRNFLSDVIPRKSELGRKKSAAV